MSLKAQFISCHKAQNTSLKSSKPQPSWTPAGIRSSLDDAGASPELIKALLYEVIRPAFSRSRSKNVTEQGRKAMESWQPTIPYDSDAIAASKPWRYTDAWVVDVFEWCLKGLDVSHEMQIEDTTVEEHWPMLIPPVLAHIDDDDNACRIRGCKLLQLLLEITPTTLLTRTGMGEVFEQALLPHLVHIPPAFDEAESLSLLAATYPALLKLVQVRFPKPEIEIAIIPGKSGQQKSLDRILRQGVFACLAQMSDNVAVSRLLLQQLGPLLDELGVLCVKHLKLMVPLVSERLTSPFATAAPELMNDAAAALGAIMINAGPRVPNWRLEILEATTLAWLRILAESVVTAPLQLVQVKLREDTKILRDAISRHDPGEAAMQVQRVLESDARLSPLLETWFSPVEK